MIMNDFARHPQYHDITKDHHYAPLALSPTSRADLRAHPNARRRTSTRKDDQQDEDPACDTQRRRIAVACARCRKRKIRCSGDPGNGTGCSNCRQAGADLNQCTFHRVGSYTLNSQDIREYPMSSPMHGQVISPNSQYASNSIVAMNSMSLGPTASGPYVSHSHMNQLTQKHMQMGWEALPFAGDSSPVETYGVQSSPYMASQPGVIYAAPPNGSRGWHERVSLDRGMLPSQEPPRLYYSTPHGYITTQVGRHPVNVVEGLSALSMGPPKAPPPTSMAPPDRMLPMPQSLNPCSHPNLPIAAGRSLSMPNSASMHGHEPPYMTGRHNSLWHEFGTSSGRQPSVMCTTSGEPNPPPTSRASFAYSGLPNPTSLGYMTPFESGEMQRYSEAAPEHSGTATSTYTATAAENHTDMITSVSSSMGGNPGLTRNDSHTNLYSYSSSSPAKREAYTDHESGEGMLSSGQRYTPLVHPQPQHATSMDALCQDSLEQRATVESRAPSSRLNRSF